MALESKVNDVPNMYLNFEIKLASSNFSWCNDLFYWIVGWVNAQKWSIEINTLSKVKNIVSWLLGGSSPTELTSINTVKQEQEQTAKTQPVPTFGWKFKGANHKPELGKWFTTQDGSNRRLRLNPFYTNSLPLEASQKMTIRCSPGFMSNSCWAAPLSLPSSQPRILRQVIQNRWQLHVGRLETFCLNFICVLMNLISVFFWHSQFDLFELWFQTAPGWAYLGSPQNEHQNPNRT